MIDTVLITTYSREYLEQAVESFYRNSLEIPASLTIVLDGYKDRGNDCFNVDNLLMSCDSLIVNVKSKGASAARNIGASSIPKHKRGKYVMFIDDDVYMLPRWDETLLYTIEKLENAILSGHSHPFNHPVGRYKTGMSQVDAAQVLSTVHMIMPWHIWDDVGFFVEPGGPGGSEDVDYCRRAIDKGYGLAVTVPHCVMHCGLTSSNGNRIVGYDLMAKQNDYLMTYYDLEGQIHYE